MRRPHRHAAIRRPAIAIHPVSLVVATPAAVPTHGPGAEPSHTTAVPPAPLDPAASGAASTPGSRVLSALRGHWAIVLILLLLGLAAALWAPRWLQGPRVPVTEVVRRDFVQSVVAAGHVETPHRVSLGTQIGGVVARVPVAEGQAVDKGQLLIELDDGEARAAAAQADAAVMQAMARLRQLGEVQAPVAAQTVRVAQVNRDNARAHWTRNAELYRQGFIGRAALDDLQKNVDLAEAQLQSAIRQRDTASPGGSDHALAMQQLTQARAAADAARSRLGYTRIAAPVAGTLIARNVEPGDAVLAGKSLMVLSPAGEVQVVAQIDERNLGLLATGQTAKVSADAYPAQRFEARLAYINPGVDVQRGSVEVKLSVADPPAYLRQDMTVSIDIDVAFRPQALMVPSDALHDADSDHPWAMVLADGRAERRDLRLGLRAGGMNEVLSGLEAGDRVVPASVAGAVAGARLRPLTARANGRP
ncbi:MAG: efflux RND transporter periplasmic adaptor subunit [Gammaproteobacteria bacterium]|nr:efflux RND transporter periplasmic adaptor subunit [Gammaproteobacteria bacterium]